jgi:hypothetical protein
MQKCKIENCCFLQLFKIQLGKGKKYRNKIQSCGFHRLGMIMMIIKHKEILRVMAMFCALIVAVLT